jgi:guanosine-3',5'-bis(diphosphate) 3'-pyrophosphohydrolase
MNSADTIPGRPSQNGLTVHPEKIRAAREFLIEVNPDAVERADVVLSYLLDLGPDDDATIAGMIFAARVPLDTHGKIIQERFGVGVEKLLGFLYKVHTLRPDFSRNDTEVLRQVILMMAQDIRVMLVRLADRLCEMKTLDTFSHEEQKQISQESLKIYAPVASRLGMYSMKWQLEDLAFANLNPSQYESITRQLEQFGRARRLALDDFERETIEFLHQRGVVCRITSRTKSVYSIYRKMRRKSTDQITDLHDIFAIRIIVPTVMGSGRESTELLYSLLGMIHNEWTPIPGRFKDYIAVPKPNGYQSLHTAIFTATPGLKNQPVEIQIRSEKMHREAEYGIAAHWLYESTRAASTQIEQRLVDGEAEGASESSMMSDRLKRQLDWLRGLVKSHDDEIRSDSGHTDGDTQDFRIDIFHDRIFVFTPNGEVKDLPVGATPVDFAYSVHTDIGHRCAMARVNGGIVPLNAILKNGDVIDVVLKPKPNPRSEWLSFVKTTSARQKIKIWFKSQNRELSLREGRDLINKHLRRLNKASTR